MIEIEIQLEPWLLPRQTARLSEWAYEVAERQGIALREVRWFDQDPMKGIITTVGTAIGWSYYPSMRIEISQKLHESQAAGVIIHELTHLKCDARRVARGEPRPKQVHSTEFYETMIDMMIDEADGPRDLAEMISWLWGRAYNVAAKRGLAEPKTRRGGSR